MLETANSKGIFKNRQDLLQAGLGHVSPTSFPCAVYVVDMAGPKTIALAITAKDIAELLRAAPDKA